MPFDPWLRARLDALRDLPAPSTVDGDFATPSSWDADPAPWMMPAGVRTQDLAVDGLHGPVPVRVYRTSESVSGVLVWMHGGGFVAGDLDFPEAHTVSAELAARTGFHVVSVDYRLANDGIRFPVPVDDAVAAIMWARGEFGTDVPFAFGGASAGTTLSLSAAIVLRDEHGMQPDGVLLAYPFVHFPVPDAQASLVAELDELPEVLRLKHPIVSAIVENYVGRITELPPLAVPGYQPLAGLAPMWVMVSEYDDFRPSGELLVEQLREQGVAASLYLAAGMPHGHLNRLPSLPEVDRSLDYFAKALRDIQAAHTPTL